ncbi:hypothetical protein NHJ13051_008396 [Beauveria bassiana]
MAKFQTPVGVLIAFALLKAMAAPVADTTFATFTRAVAHEADAWELTLSNDTHHRIDVARKHLGDQSHEGQAFRNDTMMRVNIEREALDLPLVDLFQAFGMALPKARPTTNSKAARSEAEEMREAAYLRGGTMYSNGKATRSEAEEMREAAYLRGGTMYSNGKRSEAEEMPEEMREAAYLRGGTMYSNGKRSEAEEMREAAYLRGGTMYSNGKATRSEAEEMREAAYLRGGTMYSNGKRSEAEEMREAAYLRGGTMYSNGKTTRSEAEEMRGSLPQRWHDVQQRQDYTQ